MARAAGATPSDTSKAIALFEEWSHPEDKRYSSCLERLKSTGMTPGIHCVFIKKLECLFTLMLIEKDLPALLSPHKAKSTGEIPEHVRVEFAKDYDIIPEIHEAILQRPEKTAASSCVSARPWGSGLVRDRF
jgi:hypothetical protein